MNYTNKDMEMNNLVQRLRDNADIDEAEGCTASVVALEREAADRIAQLEADLADARKVISVVDGLVTAKGRYHTAQWYQKMVTALDEYKAAVKEQGK